MYWQRVTIQESIVFVTDTGGRRFTWSDLLSDAEARVLPLISDETRKTWATPEEDAYEIQLRGAHPEVEPPMRAVVDGVHYDIRHVIQPPPFGTPTTVLQAVRVTP